MHCSWDPVHARFTADCSIYISAIPSLAAVLILGCYALDIVLRNKPLWLSRFAAEDEKLVDELGRRGKSWNHWTVALLVVAALGLLLSIVIFAVEPFEALCIVPWTIALLATAFRRPTSAPYLLLALYSVILICRVLILPLQSFQSSIRLVCDILALCLPFTAIMVIVMMPMRSLSAGDGDISKPFQPPTHYLRSPEDNMTLWHFMTVAWMAPLISLGRRKQLNDEDVWLLPYEFQHRRLHYLFRDLQGSVIGRLLQANGLDLVITTLLGILQSVADFSSPVLLQQLLRSIENEHGSRRAAVSYSALILVVRLVAAQSGVFSLWFGRRCYERSRGEMITMAFEKALSRKAFGLEGENPEAKSSFGSAKADGSSKPHDKGVKKPGKLQSIFSRPAKAKEKETRASAGKILNLIKNDVYEVAQRFWEFQTIVTKPLDLLLSVFLVWKLLGWPCLIGVSAVVVAQMLNAILIRILLRLERVRRTATDTRLQVSSQFIEAIRHLRWYDWQQRWLDRILNARQHELGLRVITGLWNVCITSLNYLSGGLFPVVAFAAYTLLAQKPLTVDIAFPAIQLFGMLDTNLRDLPMVIKVLLDAYVALGRIEDFMNEPDKEKPAADLVPPRGSLIFDNASFAWPSTTETVLNNISLEFSTGLTLICGRVGHGKTALLQAALGELDRRGGAVSRPDEMIGYCSQLPWLQSMSIRENILFSAPYDDKRYKQTLEASALIPDFASFKHGDLSNIGENGIGLSGGQRARVALARAVYSRARILLLDDPLAALDHDTATTIVQRLFNGPLMHGRTVILVTHRVDICAHLANQIVEIHEGQASLVNKPSSVSYEHGSRSTSPEPEYEAPGQEQDQDHADAVPDKFIEEEHRATGGVVASVYWKYVKSGNLWWWALLIIAIVLFRAIRVLDYWFLKSWGEAYGTQEISTSFFDFLPSPESNVRPWLVVFLILAIVLAVAVFLTDGMMLVIVYVSGRKLFKDVLDRVSSATFRFYDVTPTGRLMNRLTSDFGTLDGNISWRLQIVAWGLVSWLSSVSIIASTTPLFLVFTLSLTALFAWIFMWFLPTSQSLRRLEMVSLSPLMSSFGTLLEGLTTVRAFRAQTQFQDRVISVTDAFQKMDHFYWSLQAWLMFRFDTLSAISTFLLTLLALYDNLSQGLTAFVLTSAANFIRSTHLVCRQYGQLQMDFVSVERVVELLELEQEPTGNVDPPASWPSYNHDVVFDNVTIKYAPHLVPALSEVSFRIPGGSTTAIIGRTGSGKSTLALALLATVRPEPNGSISIGSMDLSKVNVHALRQRVTFVAQDPVLFPGTLRENLDPNEEYSDGERVSVLHRIFATASSGSSFDTTSAFTLESRVETGGKNFSQGQRQLIGLGRAILRRSPIVILDEATASIDNRTALEVQRVLREELADSTVIMIAHRVEAVREAGWAIVLDKKRVVASGPAAEIVEKQFQVTQNDESSGRGK